MAEQAIASARPGTRAGFAAALQYPTFVVLWLSEAVSLVGDRLIMVVLVTLVYERTQSPTAVGILMMLKAIPALALGSVAGVFVDRWNRKWVMVGANLIQGLLILLIPITDALPVVFAVYLAMSVVNQFFIPARTATIPTLVSPHALLAANSLFSTAFVGAIALGPALGGWIAEQFGTKAAFYVDSATFLVPALAVGMLAIPWTQRPLKRDVRTDLSEGFAFIRARPDMLAALALTMAAFLVMGTINVLGIVLARENLHVGTGGFGVMMSAMGVGMVAGAVAVGSLGHRFNRIQLSIAGVGLMGVAAVSLPWVTQFYLALALALFSGLGMVMVQVGSQTTFQTAPENLRGRVVGLGSALLGGTQFLTMALVGFMAEQVGSASVLVGAGLIAMVTGATMLFYYRATK